MELGRRRALVVDSFAAITDEEDVVVLGRVIITADTAVDSVVLFYVVLFYVNKLLTRDLHRAAPGLDVGDLALAQRACTRHLPKEETCSRVRIAV